MRGSFVRFLENLSLAFHEIWHENAQETNNGSIEKNRKFNRGNYRNSRCLSSTSSVSVDQTIKIMLTCEHRYKRVACN